MPDTIATCPTCTWHLERYEASYACVLLVYGLNSSQQISGNICESFWVSENKKRIASGHPWAPDYSVWFWTCYQKAVEPSFPATDFRGCYYDFFQALMRMFQNIGLLVPFREDTNVNWFPRRTASLLYTFQMTKYDFTFFYCTKTWLTCTGWYTQLQLLVQSQS